MPYLDVNELEAEVALSLVQTVRGNMEGYTKREVEKAREAREAQAMVGHPTDRDFLGMVRANMITNCPVTEKAVINANRIFGPDLAGVRGRTVRRPPESVTTDYVQIPREILERHRLVTLSVDVMFVNGVPFLVSTARGLNFITVEYTKSRTAKALAGCVRHIMDMYGRGGFQVGTVLMDNEFECLRNLIPVLDINTTAAKEHVPEIERRIRLIKERGRGILNTLPFKKLPRIILIELIYHAVMWLNSFPSKSGISQILSPREIVTRHKLDFRKHCKAPFGAYCEAHDEPSPTNSMASRSSPAINLGPTGNLQGTHKFFNLATGKKVKRRKFTVMPMPDSAIKAVERYGSKTALPGAFDFSDRNNILFEWNDEIDETPVHIVEEEVVQYPSLVAEMPGIDLQRDHTWTQTIEEDEDERQGRVEDAAINNADIEPAVVVGVTIPATIQADAEEIEDEDNDDDDSIIQVVTPTAQPPSSPLMVDGEDQDDHFDADDEDEDYADEDHFFGASDDDPHDDHFFGASDDDPHDDPDDHGNDSGDNQGVRKSNRANRGINTKYRDDYELLMATKKAIRGGSRTAVIKEGVMCFSTQDLKDLKPVPEEDRDEFALGVALTTYGLNAGLKKFGKAGEASIDKELNQMHDLNVFVPVEAGSLTREQKAKALQSLLMLKEKRDKTVKSRLLADGRGQRDQFAKQETTSPTVATESVFISAVIDAHERRCVATFDIPGAFLNADCDENDDEVIMILRGRLAELMVQVAPNMYRKFITVDGRGTPILYVKMEKAMYGLLKSALLFYRLLVSDLLKKGFTLNPYDPCVANKMIDGLQMTVIWHVDDLKVSHVVTKEVDEFGDWLTATYGKKVTAHRGQVHDYLGMIFDYRQDGVVMINQIEYIKSILKEFPEEITKTRVSPAADYLFTVRDASEVKPLPEEQAVYFHRTVAQVNYVAARARRDIHPCTAFLQTRVQRPDEDDWGKLKRLLGYLKGTLHMPLILSAESLTLCRWWVDASFAVHNDCKGHTGAGMSFGRGMVLGYSWKQKQTAKSSTEGELYGVDDSLGQILWARYFMQEQGYDMEPSLIYQDNMSAILLENNGKFSSSKRTRHIKIKYYHMKEKKDDGEIRFEHCPTEQMWADINTKPKQGSVFREFRGHVMGIPAEYNDDDYRTKIPSTVPKSMLPMTKAQWASKECVGGNVSDTPEKPKKGVTWNPVIETQAQQTNSVPTSHVSLRMVQGRKWSMNAYRSYRLRGYTLDRAWKSAFVDR